MTEIESLKELMDRRQCLLRKARTLVDDLNALKGILEAANSGERRDRIGRYTGDHGDTFPGEQVRTVAASLNEVEGQIADLHKIMVGKGYGDLVPDPLRAEGIRP